MAFIKPSKGKEPLMIWGGAGKSGKKKLNGYSLWKKKLQQLVAEEKKKLNTNSLPGPPPRSLMVRP